MFNSNALNLLFLLFCFPANSVYAENSAPVPVYVKNLTDLGLTKNCLAEPVFNGRACIYEINPTAEDSVVFIHGLNADANSWYEQIAVLKDKYHIIAFDLPGFGQSSRGNNLYSPSNYAYFVNFIKHQYIKKPFYLIGHSMGGAVALRYSAMYPDDIKRLVLADVGGVLHQYSFAKSVAFKWLKFFKQITYWALPDLQEIPSMNALANMFFQSLDWLPINIRDALQTPELRKIILQGNASTIAGAAVALEDFSSAIRANKIPTLIVWGAYDLVTPIRTASILQTRLVNSYLRVLPRSAHSPMTDQPAEFNQLVLKHLTAADIALLGQRWRFRPFKSSQRIGRCINEREKYFEGNYLRIELNNCGRAVLYNVNAGSVVATNSEVFIEKSQLFSEDIAITLFDSSLELTSSNIQAQIGIQTTRSHIDVAGVNFRTGYAAVNNLGKSDAVFSVSEVNGRTFHLYKDFTLAGKI